MHLTLFGNLRRQVESDGFSMNSFFFSIGGVVSCLLAEVVRGCSLHGGDLGCNFQTRRGDFTEEEWEYPGGLDRLTRSICRRSYTVVDVRAGGANGMESREPETNAQPAFTDVFFGSNPV